jgi:glucose uptake protein GlcU
MTSAQNTLGRILTLDALTCAAMGLLLLVVPGPVAGLTAIPAALLFYAGAVLIPIAIYMAAVARIGTCNAPMVWLVIIGNIGWIAASLALFAFIAPNGIGTAFILAQASVVGLLAWLEVSAWRSANTDDSLTA